MLCFFKWFKYFICVYEFLTYDIYFDTTMLLYYKFE